MTPAEQVAAALAANNQITLRDLQIALEWQRGSDATVLDVLVYLELVDTPTIRDAANSLRDIPELSINHDIGARQEVDRRRQFKRLDLPNDVTVTVAGEPVGKGTELLNLSLGGIGYSAAEAPALDERVAISIRSSAGNVVDTNARVRYRRQLGDKLTVGLEFDELTPAGVMVLDSIIKDLDSQARDQ